jgi:hypothetical protein
MSKNTKKHLPSSVEDKMWIELLTLDINDPIKSKKFKDKWVKKISKHITKNENIL